MFFDSWPPTSRHDVLWTLLLLLLLGVGGWGGLSLVLLLVEVFGLLPRGLVLEGVVVVLLPVVVGVLKPPVLLALVADNRDRPRRLADHRYHPRPSCRHDAAHSSHRRHALRRRCVAHPRRYRSHGACYREVHPAVRPQWKAVPILKLVRNPPGDLVRPTQQYADGQGEGGVDATRFGALQVW